ncbi:MAG: putative bifunctional diguanylate cyclase/phosphodiesterase [Methyloceanibacter sp.]|uniref:putative bifunctional diguanylate cyclase/phosphodiesterase n=1 Tax=Methyloceanibacter sp. TaxID=1965321 RepID=UPI003D6CE850
MSANPDKEEEERLRALRDLGLLDTPRSEAFDRITRMASQLFGLPICAVSLTDHDRQWFKSRVGVDATQIPRDKAPCARVASDRHLVVVPDLLSDEDYRDSPLAAAGVRFYAGAPLLTRDGFGLGSMCVLGPEPRTVTKQELAALKDLAAMVMAQIELEHAFGRVDPVSGLPNRNQLIEDLEDQARDHPDEERVAVLMDLADQRQLAEAQRALGPHYVDDLVRFAKAAIQSRLSGRATLYHIGTTDFACVLNEPNDESLQQTLFDIQASLTASVESSGVPVAIDAAIGIAPLRLGETAPADVLRTAYGAALDAREAELDVETHSPLKDEEHRRRFGLLVGLRDALSAPDQLSLVYQPRVDLRTGACVCVEALLRWHHPSLGSVTAAEFIPLVEQTALARPVTDWVLENASKQTAAWKQAGLGLRVSINISAANLEEDDFAQRVGEALARHDLLPDDIELEFTESALIRHRARVLEQLEALKAIGVGCAIDDFGTGYSSFSYLQDLPADVIKIDQSFMRRLDRERDRRLVKAMISMGHELGYRVVAEGVEMRKTYDFLARSGCDEAQGFFISRPLPPAALRKWLAGMGPDAGETQAA